MNRTTHHAFEGMKRNLARLASGAIVSQAILVASTPLLTRIYSPDAFGVMAIFSSTYAITIPLTTLKYDAALILPKAKQSALSTSWLVFFIATTISILALGLVAFSIPIFGVSSHNLWLPIALWLGAIYTLMQQWCARRGNYRDYARSQVIGAIFNIGLSVGFGFFLDGRPIYLIIGFVAGLAASLSCMIFSYQPTHQSKTKVRPRTIMKRAWVYRQFPLLVLPTAFLVTIGQSGIPLILNANYSLDDTGQFAVANRLLLVPAALIGGALSEAFRSEFVRRQRERQTVLGVFGITLRTLLVLALPLFGFIAITAPYLFALIFGKEYEQAGHVARAVISGVAAQFIGNPFASVFVALRQAGTGLRVQIAITTVPALVLLAAAALQLPLTSALAIYSAANVVGIGIMIIMVWNRCRHFDSILESRRGN